MISSTNYSSDIINYANKYIYVREISNNRSATIDSFNINVSVKVGSPWCASYVSWVLDPFVNNPHSAYSPNFAKKKDIIYKKNLKNNIKIKSGDVVTFYYSNLGRVGHVGLVIKQEGDILYTIEGNTNDGGSREGDGVYKKKRDINKIYAITRYN